MKLLKVIVSFLALLGVQTSVNGINNDNEIKYYAGFSGYNHPIKLVDEIKESEIPNMLSYLKGTYNNGKLMVVEKYLGNELFFKYEYYYVSNKLKKMRLSGGEEPPQEIEL